MNKPVLLSSGGGLLASAADYLRIAQMLLNEGEYGNVRLLAPHTVSRPMSATPISRGGWVMLARPPEMGQRFGSGLAVRTAEGQCWPAP